MLRIPFLFFVFLSHMAIGQTGSPINIDKIVAKVDNYYILKSEVESLKLRAKENGQEMETCQAFESLVIQKLLVAKAEIDSVMVEEDDVKSELDARMAQMSQIYGSEKNIVEQFGKTIETLKSELRGQLKQELTADKMRQTIVKGVSVTPKEVKDFFEEIPKDSLPKIPSEVKLSQIVRLGIVTKNQKDDIIRKLNDLKDQVSKGADFAELAKQFSEDPGSGPKGGDLGWAKRGNMVPEFEAAAMRLDSGKLSDIVESDFGYHLIQTLEMRGQEYHARHILMSPDYSILDMSEPKRFLDSIKTLITADSIKFEKAVKAHSQDKETFEAGGIIMDPESGSNMLSLDVNMEPNLYFAINSLKKGEISSPMNYRNQRGKTGVRIVQIVDMKPEHIASYEYDYEKLKAYALNQKQNLEVNKWFKEAQKEVFIKVDPEFENCKLFNQ
ncbi:MAG: peptidylprolyl isomerase [Leadbetterella sp.]